MKLIHIAVLASVILTSCSFGSNSLVGKWESTNQPPEYLIFNADDSFDVQEEDGTSLQAQMTAEQQGYVGLSYEAITEIEPYQLYMVMHAGGSSWKEPIGIYKVEGNKLILRRVTEFHRTLGGFDMGVSRVEMPKDFSGVVETYIRVN